MRRLIFIAFLLLTSAAGSAIAASTTGSITGSNPTSAPNSPPGTITDQNGLLQNLSTSTASSSANLTALRTAVGALPPSPQPGQTTAPGTQPATNPPSASTQPSAPAVPNATSEVFGSALFTGTFAQQGPTQFNPDYLIASGDQVQVRLWGGFSFDSPLAVDPQGNIFLPQVGPVKVAGVPNKELQTVVESVVRKVFRSNVYCYASLAAAQPVRIFVGGFVKRPGLYNGTSMDSILHYLDMAGGIDPDRGSFLDVQVKRGAQVRADVNLYDFLLRGTIPLVQLADGDVIFVPTRQSAVAVVGLADNTNQFEFQGKSLTIGELSAMAKPSASATHMRVTRNSGTVQNTEYYPLSDANDIQIGNGDSVEYTADKKPGTITVRVEGEHDSPEEYVLPYGARLGDLMRKIKYSERSDAEDLQLYRLSVHDRQKAMLNTSLNSFQAAVLTARSGTSDEAVLRKNEADLLLQWVDRARAIEPTGQVLIALSANRDKLLLENGDIIRIPTRDGLVLVGGEVLFPNAIAYDSRLVLPDYIRLAGGYTQNADNTRIVIAHRDGSFDDGKSRGVLRAGDQVLVLPKVDVKSRQIFKEMTQIIYQIAVSAKVVLGL